jgi:hypothetical protein
VAWFETIFTFCELFLANVISVLYVLLSCTTRLPQTNQTTNTMKRSRMLTYCENLRDVVTIHELIDGSIIATSTDKITMKRTWLDGMDDECRAILATHSDTVICA